jgi:IMP dehydrogenase
MVIPRVQTRELRRTYGFEEVAIVPGDVTSNPDLSVADLAIGPYVFSTPVLAAAMDAVVDPAFAGHMSKLGGLAVMNLEGVQTRYDNPEEVIAEISVASKDDVTSVFQRLYAAPVREELVAKRVGEIKATGAVCAVSMVPAIAKKMAPMAVEAGADIIVVQSTVTTARHFSRSYRGLIFSELVESIGVPVLVGNVVTYSATMELMEQGIDGLLVGVGPGAACTTRDVTGIGVPQVSGTLDCAAARDDYYVRGGKYVVIITDGGIRTGGDLCKAFAAGADGVMLGTPMAQTAEAPGKGFNWGMASPHPALPRGTRINVGVKGTLEEVLYGPSHRTDGTLNLIGALKVCMGYVGASTIKEFHERAELVVAPSIATEGKIFQQAGMI